MRAVEEFTSATRPVLASSSFHRVAAADFSRLPPVAFFHASDGYGVAYRHYASTSHANLAVVLVHGAGCFGDQLHVLASAIAEKGLADVYTLDMRGHGLSGGPGGHAVDDPAELVRDVAEFVTDVRGRPGSPRVILGGHSAGGGIVLALSRTKVASLVSGFLFIAPFLGLGSTVNRPHFGGWVRLRTWPLRLVVLANLFRITAFNDTTVVDFAMDACSPDPRYVATWSFATLLAFGPGPWRSDATPIDHATPVLVLAGAGDECFVQQHYSGAFGIVAPHATIPEIGDAGHWDVLADPAAIAATTEWLSTLAGQALSSAGPGSAVFSGDADTDVEASSRGRMRAWRSAGARIALAGLLTLASHVSAAAQQAAASLDPPRTYVRVGLAGLVFEPDSTFTVEGQSLPGAGVHLSSSLTAAAELGYYVSPRVSVSVTAGLPPKTHVDGGGSLSSTGLLGTVRYGTMVALADYHFNWIGRLQPWIGAGPAFLLVLGANPEAVQNLRVGNRWGAAFQVGTDYMLSQRWGLYASVTQSILGTEARGNVGPYRIDAKLTLDPVVMQAGVEFRF